MIFFRTFAQNYNRMEFFNKSFSGVEWQLIYNPNALGFRRLALWQSLETQLPQLSINYEKHIASSGGECRQLLCRLCEEGKRHFMIAGGDGTLNESINGIFLSRVDTTEVFVVVIPIGTGNDWSRTHLYPQSLTQNLEALKDGRFILHDIGLVESIDDGKVIDKRFFLNIAGFGFDATVIDQTKGDKPARFPSLVYLFGVLKVLFSYRATQVELIAQNQHIDNKIYTIAVGIGQYNGNGMRQVPMAVPNDGQLDVVVIKDLSKWKVIRNVKNLYTGTHIRLKEVTHFRTTQLRINGNGTLLGEVEGEMLAVGEYQIDILPQAIHLITFNQKLLK